MVRSRCATCGTPATKAEETRLQKLRDRVVLLEGSLAVMSSHDPTRTKVEKALETALLAVAEQERAIGLQET